MSRAPMHSVADLNSSGSHFYRAAIQRLLDAKIPFLVGGAYALEVHTGIVRRTKDFDIFMQRADVGTALEVLAAAGYPSEMAFPHWIAKSFCGEDFIDIIFSSGNGVCPVDNQWFQHAVPGEVLGMPLQLCPAEESIWQKAYILERDRCDVADVAHLIRPCGERLDWDRLLHRFGPRWQVLFAQLVLFDFIYPGHRSQVPENVRDDLHHRYTHGARASAEETRCCNGTLLSATQYLRDIDLERYVDARLRPQGNMSQTDVAVWTANFMKPG